MRAVSIVLILTMVDGAPVRHLGICHPNGFSDGESIRARHMDLITGSFRPLLRVCVIPNRLRTVWLAAKAADCPRKERGHGPYGAPGPSKGRPVPGLTGREGRRSYLPFSGASVPDALGTAA